MAVIFGVSVFAAESRAQVVPESAEPARIEKRFDPVRKPLSTDEPLVPKGADEATPPDNAKEITFDLKEIRFEGATVYAADELLPLYESYLGERVSLADVYAVANALTRKYRNDGFILSRAVVPAQRIKEGVVIIKVIEGFIDRVLLKGERRDYIDLIRVYGSKIAEARPLNVRDLERYLLLMRDIPGHHAESLLQPSPDKPGAADLVIETEYDPVDASISFDNRGTRYVGPRQLTASVGGNALAGLGEQITVRAITTGLVSTGDRHELKFFDVGYRQTVTGEGTTLGARFAKSLSQPGYTLKISDVKSRSTTANVEIRHPFIRSRARNLSGRASFSYVNSETKFAGTMLSKDRVRSVRLGGTYDFVDGWRGINMLDVEISKGLHVLDSSDKENAYLSRATGRPDYLKWTASASRLQHIWSKLNLFAAASGQHSAHNLLSSEEFGVGGSGFGRGYDPSEITGDHGLAGKAELQWGDSFDLPVTLDWQLYGFFDAGAVYHTGDDNRDTLTSTGAGVRFNITDYISGYLEWAKPLTRPVAAQRPDDGNDHRFFFFLSARM